MCSRQLKLTALALLLTGIAASQAQADPPRYTAVRVYDSTISGFPRSIEYRDDMNNLNQVLGRTLFTSSYALWEEGQMRNFTLPAGHTGVYAYRVNDSGRALFAGNDPGGKAAVWLARPNDTGRIFMQTPAPNWHNSQPFRWGLDYSGQVLGTTRDSVTLFNGGMVWMDRAAMWSPSGTGYLLGLPDELRDSADVGLFRNSWGAALSDRGAVVIKARGLFGSPAVTIERHYVLQGTGWMPLVPLPGWENVRAAAVSDGGHVVGDMRDPTTSGADPHAFIWRSGQITDLHAHSFTLSMAADVNRRGHVVGTYYDEVFQGGNFPITVARTGFVYRDGEQYILNDVVTGGFGMPSIAVAVNEAGVILVAAGNSFEFTFLLMPSDTADYSLHVVNSTGDDGDADLSDGICATGWQLQNGVDECTFRAALEQSNSTSDQDTILFSLPADDLTIEPESPLPAVSEPVWINGAAAGSKVMLDGGHPGYGDSLVVGAEGSSLRDVCFMGFVHPALVLAGGGHHTLQSCEFGHDPDSGGGRNASVGLVVASSGNQVGGRLPGEGNRFRFNDLGGVEVYGDSNTISGNLVEHNGYASDSGAVLNDEAHGIEVFGSHNQVGDYFFAAAADTVRHNAGAGVFLADGVGIDLRNNRIHANAGLGIDIAPWGVNVIDSLDLDAGPNDAVNAPRIDSIRNEGVPTAYGTMLGEPNYGYVLEVFKSDSCDCSGYGEGRFSLTTMQVVTDAMGRATFTVTIDDTSQVMSLTATRDDRSTSEFSRCFVQKHLTITDYQGDPLPRHRFALSRKKDGQEMLVDSVTTDDSACVNLKPYVLAGELDFNDTVRVSKHVYAQPNPRASSDLFGTRYNVSLDNMKINDTTSVESYDTLTAEPHQEVELGHALFSYNLLISLEWEPQRDPNVFSYFEMLHPALDQLSSYLYDVYDGQVRLDTVVVWSNRNRWREADIRVYAQNDMEPWAPLFGGTPHDPEGGAIKVSRRWFGSAYSAPDRSAEEYPVDPAGIEHTRMLGKLLGKYLHAFRFENTGSAGCQSVPNHGMMDDPYPSGGEAASELSWQRQYNGACNSNDQYSQMRKSCWDWLEVLLEKSYNLIDVPITEPGERALPNGSDWLSGPHKFKAVEFDPRFIVDGTRDRLFSIYEHDVRLGKAQYAEVLLEKRSGGAMYSMHQGEASWQGNIWLVGTEPGDSIRTIVRQAFPLFGPFSASAATAYTWQFASTEVQNSDSLEITLAVVYGDYPVVPTVGADPALTEVRLFTPTGFPQPPSLAYSDSTGAHSVAFVPNGSGSYSADLPWTDGDRLDAHVVALDDSGHQFFFPLEFTQAQPDTLGSVWQFANHKGDLSVAIDGPVDTVTRAVTVSTLYPTSLAGTLSGSVQGGRAHAVDFWPPQALPALSYIAMAYSDSDLVVPGAVHTLEQSLRVYRWDEIGQQWSLVGGVPDTTENVVWTILPGPGTYTLFTQDQLASVKEKATAQPDVFTLSQNYPNPFNPATAIAFTLPRAAHVTVDVLNILGQQVIRLADARSMSAGRQEVNWDGHNQAGRRVASGPYLYRVQAGEQVQIRKMLLLK